MPLIWANKIAHFWCKIAGRSAYEIADFITMDNHSKFSDLVP